MSVEEVDQCRNEYVGGVKMEVASSENIYTDDEPDDIIILHCDIRQPLRILRNLVERKIGVLLEGYSFWLQDAQELESHKNLVDQCVKGEGLVQINVQVQTINKRINIVDVLKPTEAALAALTFEETNDLIRSTDTNSEKLEKVQGQIIERPSPNWVQDKHFKEEQIRLNIPEDPNDWNVSQVQFWLKWAVKEFDLEDISIKEWTLSGKELCALNHTELQTKITKDPSHLFWTHLQLLKESKCVSIINKDRDDGTEMDKNYNIVESNESENKKELKIMRKSFQKGLPIAPNPGLSYNSCYIVGSGNNGQIQLWQFLLDLLTDRQHRAIIQWVGDEGEFKLIDPERVARLWGEKKNKPAMNYEKLSRALRYYYDGDMISKVSGKRFAYKFDCDLHLLIGYNAAELSKLVNENPISEELLTPDYINFQSEIE